jgi:hypothetical protein
MEKIGYPLVAIAAVGLSILLFTEIESGWVALFVLAAVAGFGLLLAKVVRDRRANTEDDHYAKTVDK